MSAVKRRAAPIRQIVENAGVKGSVVVRKLLEKSGNWGFNAQTEEYVDMVQAGIIDQTKVVRVALQDAASVAALLITTEAMIAKKATGPLPKFGSRIRSTPKYRCSAGHWANYDSTAVLKVLFCRTRNAGPHPQVA